NILPHLKSIKPAVLVVGGWFDAEDLSGTLKTYRAIKETSPSASNTIVMGPWYHGGWSNTAGNHLGDINFASNTGEFFRDKIELPFFKRYLKGEDDPHLPSAYMFETGRNQWKQYEQWPPRQAKVERIYLRSGGKLSFEAPAANE